MGRGTNWTIRGKLNFVVDIVRVYVGVLVVQGNQAVVGVEVVSHVSVVVVFVVVQVVALFVAAVFVVVVVVVVVPCEILKLLVHMIVSVGSHDTASFVVVFWRIFPDIWTGWPRCSLFFLLSSDRDIPGFWLSAVLAPYRDFFVSRVSPFSPSSPSSTAW